MGARSRYPRRFPERTPVPVAPAPSNRPPVRLSPLTEQEIIDTCGLARERLTAHVRFLWEGTGPVVLHAANTVFLLEQLTGGGFKALPGSLLGRTSQDEEPFLELMREKGFAKLGDLPSAVPSRSAQHGSTRLWALSLTALYGGQPRAEVRTGFLKEVPLRGEAFESVFFNGQKIQDLRRLTTSWLFWRDTK